MRWIIKIALFIACFCAAARFCKTQTGSFSVMRITSDLVPRLEWEVAPLSPEEEARLPSIFSQPYSYLAKGVQSFVFASQDGQYVIKFFRYNRLGAPFWTHKIPLQQCEQSAAKRASTLQKDFLSYKIAYESLKEETGLIYLHLNKTSHLNTTLDLVDKLGIHHQIPLDKYEFIVQKRATLLYPALNTMIEQGRIDDAKTTLTQLVHLLARRAQKGIYDKDPDLNTNFGVIKTTPIQIDVGRYRLKPITVNKDEIIRITDHLHQMLMKASPELDQHLKNTIEKL